MRCARRLLVPGTLRSCDRCAWETYRHARRVLPRPFSDKVERSEKEAQALFDYTIRRMLSTPPRPHEPIGRSKRARPPRSPLNDGLVLRESSTQAPLSPHNRAFLVVGRGPRRQPWILVRLSNSAGLPAWDWVENEASEDALGALVFALLVFCLRANHQRATACLCAQWYQLGSRLIKSTRREPRRGRWKRGNFLPACRSVWRCA